jgi:adenosine deaminase
MAGSSRRIQPVDATARLNISAARHAHRLAANSFEASFAGADDKLHWAGALDAAFAAAARQAQ